MDALAGAVPAERASCRPAAARSNSARSSASARRCAGRRRGPRHQAPPPPAAGGARRARAGRRAHRAPRRGAGPRRRPRSPSSSPEASAGPSERAGFIEAPVTGPPNSASRPTVPPIASAARRRPRACRSPQRRSRTSGRRSGRLVEQRGAEPTLGTVAPSCAGSLPEAAISSAAATAPASCAAT